MGESLCIDSPSRGLAMPKAYSGDLRERVIEAVETGPKMADYEGGWYRIFDELDSNVPLYVPAIHLRVLPLIPRHPCPPIPSRGLPSESSASPGSWAKAVQVR